MKHKILSVLLLVSVAAVPVLAQEEEEEKKKLWENQLGLSFVKTTGNSDNQNFGLDFNSKREATPWGFEFRAFFNSAEDSGVKTVEQYYLGGRAYRKIAKRWDVFGGLSFAKDEFAGFDLRTLVEAGVTYHALMGPKHHLSFDGGLTYTDEDRIDPNPDESWPGAVVGLAYEYKFSEKSSLTQTINFFPNFDESDDWRVNAETGLTAALTDLLGLKFGYIYRYRNLPIGDAESTDTTTTMSVVLTF
jgi:putative salt-induced outer membrane protein YdiY